MKTLQTLLVLCLLSTPAYAALTWQDLVNRPELRPTQCTLKETVRFGSGTTLKPGQKLDIVDITADEVIAGTPGSKLNFSLYPKQTDALAVANADWDKLTPKQQELTYDAVLKRQDLWPYRLKVKDTFDVGHIRLNKGDTVYLMDVKNGELVLVPNDFSMHFELLPQDTDILEQARTFVENPTGAPGILAEELQDKLVNAATGAPMKLDMNALPKYFVIYDGARWCPYTQKFTPELLKVYNELKAKHPGMFEVFYIPAEKSAAELKQYATEMNFPWPAMDYNQKKKMAVLAKVIGRSSLPEIEVVDRYGNIIIDNYTYDREEVLKQFVALINKQM